MLKRFNKFAATLLYYVTGLSCMLFFIVVLWAVLSRYLFKMPILGSVEISRLFFLWSCFMAAALCYHQKAHIAITFVTDRFSPSLFKMTEIIAHSLTVIFFLVIGKASIEVVMTLSATELPMLGISQSWLYLPVVIASAFMVLFAAEFLIDAIQGSPNKRKDHALDIDS